MTTVDDVCIGGALERVDLYVACRRKKEDEDILIFIGLLPHIGHDLCALGIVCCAPAGEDQLHVDIFLRLLIRLDDADRILEVIEP